KSGKIAIALEMFQKPYQQVINDYLAEKIIETELIEKTEYQTRWGYDWEYYAPILRYAKKFQIPVIALNVPTEITRKVSRSGLDSLTEAEKQIIPPVNEIKTDNEKYRQILLEVYRQHAENEQGNSANFQRFVLAQVLWDETMAEAIAQFHAKNSDHQIVVLAGAGHIIYNYGIPDRVKRRLGEDIQQKSVLFQPMNDQSLINDKEIADYIWWVN
ncbi:MAG: ChaN family lipoprotein, partial [Microcoleaceae cyanobacterium]